MLTIHIILIFLNLLTLSNQRIKSAIFCDDHLEGVYSYDENTNTYKTQPYIDKGNLCYDPDYVDLDVDPGAKIKIKCHNTGGPTFGAGCFLINNKCKCDEFKMDGGSIDYSELPRHFSVQLNNRVCEYDAYFLQQEIEGHLEYYYQIPLDASEITCLDKTITAPTKIKRSLKFSEYINAPFGVTNLYISITQNYKYFTLNNQRISSSYTKFKILSNLEYFSEESSNIEIKFKNYGVVSSNNKYCSFYIRFCYDSCLDCFNKEPNENSHQCSICKDDFYFIENTNNCMTKKQMENSHHYYFYNKTGKFRPCYNRCEECLFIEPDENSHQCSICKSGLYFIENTTNCMTKKEMENYSYYFDNKTEKFKPCYNSCEKCYDIEPNKNSHQCSKCKEDYYLIEDTTNCMTKKEMENYSYYFDNKTEKFKPCYNSCEKCYDIEPNKNSHQCSKCKEDYYLIEDTTNCMTKKEMENYSYYLDNKTERFKPCYNRCEKCHDIEPNKNYHQCLKCKDNYYLIENATNCMTINEMKNSRYYLDNNNKTFKQCLNECSTCINEAYCTNCKEGHHFIYNEKGKCISEPKKEDLLYLDEQTNTYIKCPEGTEKVENNKCIENSNIAIIIILTIVILIIIIGLLFFIKRIVSRKKLENEIPASLEENASNNQLINIFL